MRSTWQQGMAPLVLAGCVGFLGGCGDDNVNIAPCTEGSDRACTTAGGAAGTQTCTAGAWSVCEEVPQTCEDGTRRDCALDQDTTGEQVCSNGAWGACQSKTAPCTDGATLECTQDNGIPGQKTCVEGAWTACSPLPGQCEEGTYMDCTTGDGEDGTQQCVDYQWSECVSNAICKNGETQACSTICGTGVEICVDSEWRNCDAPKPETEICDGVDNNCDGDIDENCLCVHGGTKKCYEGPAATQNVGECHDGHSTCTYGAWGECLDQALPAATENCADQLDNDCDGEINNGCECVPGTQQNCGSNVGECEQGTQVCSATAQWGPCQNAVDPVPEPINGCNGKDDNCDGVVDNGLDGDVDEKNDSCSTARTYTLEDTAVVDTNLSLTIYPKNDVDYVRVIAEEQSVVTIPPCCPWPFCDTPDPQCHNLNVELVSPPNSGAQYQFTILVDSCVSPGQTFSSTSSKGIQWDGACGEDDTRSFWIKVEPTASSAPTWTCEPYQLSLRYSSSAEACQ